MRPHVPVTTRPVTDRPDRPVTDRPDRAAAIGRRDHRSPARPAWRHRVRLMGALTLIGAALGTGPALATDPPAPPAPTWSSKVVNSDELPIALPGGGRATTPAAAASASAPVAPTTVPAARRKTANRLDPPPVSDPVWLRIRQCESGNRYALNTGNGYYGAYQFAAGTWRRLGLAGLPHEAPPALQDQAARLLYARSGWKAWGACARRLGLR